jgi:hypothetical protein
MLTENPSLLRSNQAVQIITEKKIHDLNIPLVVSLVGDRKNNGINQEKL